MPQSIGMFFQRFDVSIGTCNSNEQGTVTMSICSFLPVVFLIRSDLVLLRKFSNLMAVFDGQRSL